MVLFWQLMRRCGAAVARPATTATRPTEVNEVFMVKSGYTELIDAEDAEDRLERSGVTKETMRSGGPGDLSTIYQRNSDWT